jgi:DNA polymerase-3 subunit epsilon
VTIDLVAGPIAAVATAAIERAIRPARLHEPSAEELAAHAALLQQIKAPLWLEA